MIAVYAAAGAIALSGFLGFSLYKSAQRNGALTEELSTVSTELENAKAQTASLVAASKQHAKDLAKSRREAAAASNQVAKVADDGCLDRPVSPAALAAMGVRPSDSNRPTSTAAAGRAKGSSVIPGPDLPRRDPVRDRAQGNGSGERG